MPKTIEVEMRGTLESLSIPKLVEKILSEGKFIQRKERVLIDYSTCLPEQGVEGRKLDIRLRNTNKVSEIILKTGAWGGSDARREYAVKTNDSFDTLVQIYKLLGLSKGVLCVRNIDVYTYHGVEIALVEVPGHSYFFEAEIELAETEGTEKARAQLKEVLHKLGLTAYSDADYFAYIEVLNKEANTIFDSNQETETYFKDTFGI
jgi:predicted adenylyl cyclase CyaB